MRQKCNWYSLVLLVLFWTPWYFFVFENGESWLSESDIPEQTPLKSLWRQSCKWYSLLLFGTFWNLCIVLFETCVLRIVSRVRVTFQSRLASNPSCGRTANAHLTSSSPPPPPAAPADDTSSLGFFWPPFYFQLLRCEHSQSPLYLMICSSDFWQPHIWTDIHIYIKWAKPKSLRQVKMAS